MVFLVVGLCFGDKKYILYHHAMWVSTVRKYFFFDTRSKFPRTPHAVGVVAAILDRKNLET